MGSRSTGEVRRELESERERLGDAAQTLRTQSGNVARKAALTAAGVAAAFVVTRAVVKRLFRD